MKYVGVTRRTVLNGGLGSAFALSVDSVMSQRPRPSANFEPPQRMSVTSMLASKFATLEAAIGEMMERSRLNPADPRGWAANAEPHRNFCAGLGANGTAQIHFCYWFLPWHRAYLSVTERKLREIAKDQTLALPYWNWTIERRIPDRYLVPASPLSRAKRFTQNRPLTDGEVDYIKDDPILRALGVGALSATKFVANATSNPIAMARELATSIGGVARPNAADVYGNTRLERSPHGPIHVYVGGVSPSGDAVGDMTDFATAGLDPLFFAHHANLDRLWEIWRQSPANIATEPKTEAFLEHRFVFPWLDGSAIEVPVKDTLSTTRMGYAYDSLQVVSADAAPVPIPEAAAPELPPIMSRPASVPAMPEAGGSAGTRVFLVIEDIASPDRPLTASVYLVPDGPDIAARILVGNIAVVRQGREFVAPGTIVFDVTTAVSVLGSQVKVIVVPNAVGGEASTPYESLRTGSLRIVRE